MPQNAIKHLHHVACAVLCVAIAACSTTPRVVAGDSALPLLSPASLGSAHQVTQVLHGEYGSRQITLQCAVNAQLETLSVTCVTSMGLRAFSITYDGKTVLEQRAAQVPDVLQASRLLNDLQLAYWPLSAVRDAWQAAGVQVTEPYPGTRRAMRGDELLAEVHSSSDPWHGRVWLQQQKFGYRLYIDGASAE